MSISFVVGFAEIFTLVLFVLLGGQIYRLSRVERPAADSAPAAEAGGVELSGRPDDILADYIGELMAGMQSAEADVLPSDRLQIPAPEVEAQPKSAVRKPEAVISRPDYPSVATLLSRRCDSPSA